MAHFGFSVFAVVIACFMLGAPEEGAIAAFSVFYVFFLDFGGVMHHRYPTIFAGLGSILLAALAGHLLIGHRILQLAGVLALATLTGWAHAAGPRIVQVLRFATVAFLIAIALPEMGTAVLPYLALGMAIGVAAVWIEDLSVGHPEASCPGSLGPETRTLILPPRRYVRFTLAYGLVATSGFFLGTSLGLARPYWVTITTLFAMQPESDATFVRLFQRVAGTFIAIPVTLLALDLSHTTVTTAAVLILSAFGIPLALVRNYLVTSALTVVFVIAGLDLVTSSTAGTIAFLLSRATETFVGAVLAAFGTALAFIGSRPSGADSTSPR